MRYFFITILSLFFAAAVSGAEHKPVSFLPRDTEFALRVQTEVLKSSPLFTELCRQIPAMVQAIEQLAPSSSFRTDKYREIIAFSTASGEEGALCRRESPDGTIIITRDGRQLVPELKSGGSALAAELPDNAPVSVVWQPPKSKNGVKKLNAALYLPGDNSLQIIAKIQCKSPKAAEKLQAQVQLMYIVFGQGVFFSENPRLGNELWQKLKLTRSGSGLNGELTVPRELFLRLLEHGAKSRESIIRQLQDGNGEILLN